MLIKLLRDLLKILKITCVRRKIITNTGMIHFTQRNFKFINYLTKICRNYPKRTLYMLAYRGMGCDV